MRTLFILNDPPYGSERVYSGLRLAASLATREEEDVWVFLIGDAAVCAQAGQTVMKGGCHIESVLRLITGHGGTVAACGMSLAARGLSGNRLVEGVETASLQDLTDWLQRTERTLVF